MKLEVLQENLSKALTSASRFASTRAQLPVLGNILLSAKKTKLVVASTNLEVSISTSVGAKVEKEGEITVPAKTITELISNVAPGAISLEAEKEQLKIEAASFKSTVSGMNSSDFPSVPHSIDEKGAIPIPPEEFLKALSQVSYSVSIDETRPILTGVLFIFQKGSLTMVATDGFRLSQKKLALSGSQKPQIVILPRSILAEVQRSISGTGAVLFSFNKNENQVVFSLDDTILSSRILEGEFPDFEKIIPKEAKLKVVADKEEVLRAVKLSSVFARESANIVRLGVTKDAIEFSAESQTSGSQRNRLDAKVEGEGVEIAFNYRFLEEFLHSIPGEEVKMEFSTPNAPGVFTDPSDTALIHLIMPVRVQD